MTSTSNLNVAQSVTARAITGAWAFVLPCFEEFRERTSALPLTKDKADAFERLTQVYLQTVPEYRTALEKVWLLREAPASVLAEIALPLGGTSSTDRQSHFSTASTRSGSLRSARLEARELDHLAPLFGVSAARAASRAESDRYC
jgi:hypothetical protein